MKTEAAGPTTWVEQRLWIAVCDWRVLTNWVVCGSFSATETTQGCLATVLLGETVKNGQFHTFFL